MILIIGSNGQLGREMQRKLSAKNVSFYACDFPDIDITSEDSMCHLFDNIHPTSVINCAAYTNVDKAETDEDNAYKINALGPLYLARLCRKHDIELIHVSTDYVFSGDAFYEDGRPRPYVESDPCKPNTAYGRTKLSGERFVQAECTKYFILRTAWLYGDGNNFARTMLKLAKNSSVIRVVQDQIGSPTNTEDLANAILSLLGSGEYGLYHATCEGSCSWYDFARQIFKEANINVDVLPVSSEEYSNPTPRPKWSVLDNAHLKAIGRNVFRPWQDALHAYIEKENAEKDKQL
jgi:dTDP-4-dehydrorhamnose reductase